MRGRLPLLGGFLLVACTPLQALDLSDPRCPATEEACHCTILLRHQALLADRSAMEDIIEALEKVQKNIQELS